jgi:heavy metal translocating P-type ATPase
MMGSGEFIEEWTIDRAHGNLDTLLELQPELCHKIENNSNEDGNRIIKDVPIHQIKPDDIILIKQGERVAVDGMVVKGAGNLDQSALNGESLPAFKKVGDEVMSGSLIVDGFLEINCITPASKSSIEKVIKLVKKAQEEKSNFQTITDKWAQIFTPLIISIAIIVWVITENIDYVINILVVSCPCALVLSVPTAFMAAIANASRNGIWVKTGASLETVGKVDHVMLDKTGTITTGSLRISDITSINSKYKKNDILEISGALEYYSSHPIAKCILNVCKAENISVDPPNDSNPIVGIGIKASVRNDTFFLGNQELLELDELDLKIPPLDLKKVKDTIKKYISSGKLTLLLSTKSEVIGVLALEDELRGDVLEFINGLKNLKINRIGILSGDSIDRADIIAKKIGVDNVKANLKPEDKYDLIRAELKADRTVAMIGDGINDAPSLALASIGIAIGIGGTALAAEQADMILHDNNLSNIVKIIKIGRRTIKKSIANIILAIILNICGIFLSLSGLLNPGLAASWHIGQSLIVVLNSTLLLKDK